MSSLHQVFSTPFNWCDRQCGRCPIADECPVQLRERQQRWAHVMRGRDPDAPENWYADMQQNLDWTMSMLTEIAQAEGIDLNAPLPKRPSVLAAKRLEKTSMALVKCLAAVSPLDDAHARMETSELRRLSTTLATKAARIACYLDDPDEETWAFDAAPNLLLLDRLKTEFAAELARLEERFDSDGRLARALAELDRNLDPLIAQVGPEARRVLAALEARGAAPSPFIRELASAARVIPG